MGCGASNAARLAEIYRVEERSLAEALDPKLKEIRLANDTISALWRRVDQDNSGSLSDREIAMILVDAGHPLASSQLAVVMKQIDNDESGEINEEEFLGWYKHSLKTDWKELPPPIPRDQKSVVGFSLFFCVFQ